MNGYYIVSFLMIAALFLITGCITSQGASSSAGDIPLSPGAEPDPVSAQQLAPTTAVHRENKYVMGDIIASAPDEDSHAKIVYGYEAGTKKYLFDTIHTGNNYEWGYRIYPDVQSGCLKCVEDSYPHVIAHIDIAAVRTSYPSESAVHPTVTIVPVGTPMTTRAESSFPDSENGTGHGGCHPDQCRAGEYS